MECNTACNHFKFRSSSDKLRRSIPSNRRHRLLHALAEARSLSICLCRRRTTSSDNPFSRQYNLDDTNTRSPSRRITSKQADTAASLALHPR